MLMLQILRCDPQSLPQGDTCADDTKVASFFKRTKFSIVPLRNFIDFNKVNVDAFPPLETSSHFFYYEEIDP